MKRVRFRAHLRNHAYRLTLLGVLACVMVAVGFASAPVARAALTERLSVASGGAQANGDSLGGSASVSGNGRYVVFWSWASDLTGGDTNNAADVFLRDRQTGRTERVSLANDGAQANNASAGASFSADGRYVAFESIASNLVSGDTNQAWDVYVRDRQTGRTERVSLANDGTQANNPSVNASISADGRYVAFGSSASNLVGGDTNNTADVFVRDRQTGRTERLNVANSGTQANNYSDFPSISADGRYVAFDSGASNLADGDTNNAADVFVRDRALGHTERISVATNGTQANNSTFVHPSITDGRSVAFTSLASNLVGGDTNQTWDVFVRDRQTGRTERVSVAKEGTQANQASGGASVSADGRYVGFWSEASNLVDGDTNNAVDVFLRDRQGDTTPPALTVPDAMTGARAIDATSNNGARVTFIATASDLVDGSVPVTCQPASGGVFPIGITTVTCTAKDNAGNTAHQSFEVQVRTPAQSLASVRDAVEKLILFSDAKTARKLTEAAKALIAAQCPKYWSATGRLDARKGGNVFAALKEAVKRLLASHDPQAAIQANRVITQAEVLTEIAIGDATTTGDPKDVAKANNELAKARQKAKDGKSDAAFNHYRNAWQHAQHALKR